jgi:hypothetical protein
MNNYLSIVINNLFFYDIVSRIMKENKKAGFSKPAFLLKQFISILTTV